MMKDVVPIWHEQHAQHMMLERFSSRFEYVLDHPRSWVAVLIATGAAVAALKFAIITLLYSRGVHGVPLRIQDSMGDGVLAAIVLWLSFVLIRERRRQLHTNLQAIAELHERLQNVLYNVVEIKDEASDEDIEAFLQTLDSTASKLRALMRIHAAR